MSDEDVLEQCAECGEWWESQEEIEKEAIFFEGCLFCHDCFGDRYRRACIAWEGEEPTDEEVELLVQAHASK